MISPAILEWEEQCRQREVGYWAKNFDEFVMRLPSIRSNRDTAQMVDDVIERIGVIQGAAAAVSARDRLEVKSGQSTS